MSYTSFEFYKNTYFGDSIPEADFEKYSSRAERVVDRYTYGRLKKHYPEDTDTQIQIGLCVCELAEKELDIEKYMKASAINEQGEASLIKSKSAGSESITFATGETVYADMVKNPQTLECYYYYIVRKYLDGYGDSRGVHLLYAGVG